MRRMKVVRWNELGNISTPGTHDLGNDEFLRIDDKDVQFFASLGNPLIELRGIEFEYGVLYRVGYLLNPLPARAAHAQRRPSQKGAFEASTGAEEEPGDAGS